MRIAGLHVETHGAEDAPAVVLSAGLGGSGGYWAPNLEALAARFRVVLYDHRGTGRSDRDLPEGLTLDHMADDLLAVLDGLGVARAHLVGHALGGAIGLAVALRAPGRLGRLVAVNSWARLDPHTARCFDVRLRILRDSGAAAFLKAQPLFLYPAAWMSAHVERLVEEEARALEHFPGPEVVEARIAALRAFDPGARLAEVSAPVLAYAAADDMLAPVTAVRALAEALPAGELFETPWGGHACNVTDPDTFNRVVPAWLAGEAPPPSARS